MEDPGGSFALANTTILTGGRVQKPPARHKRRGRRRVADARTSTEKKKSPGQCQARGSFSRWMNECAGLLLFQSASTDDGARLLGQGQGMKKPLVWAQGLVFRDCGCDVVRANPPRTRRTVLACRGRVKVQIRNFAGDTAGVHQERIKISDHEIQSGR
jgi:hypothetical protein